MRGTLSLASRSARVGAIASYIHGAAAPGLGRIGVLVTKTLAIAGEGGFATTSTGQRGAMLEERGDVET